MFYIQMYDEIKDWVTAGSIPDKQDAIALVKQIKEIHTSSNLQVIDKFGKIVYTTNQNKGTLK